MSTSMDKLGMQPCVLKKLARLHQIRANTYFQTRLDSTRACTEEELLE